MATEGMLGAVIQPPPYDGSIPASIGHLDGSANGDTLIRCVWSNAPYSGLLSAGNFFGGWFRPLHLTGKGAGVVCRGRKH